MLSGLVRFGDEDRLDASQAMQHPFFVELYDVSDLVRPQRPTTVVSIAIIIIVQKGFSFHNILFSLTSNSCSPVTIFYSRCFARLTPGFVS